MRSFHSTTALSHVNEGAGGPESRAKSQEPEGRHTCRSQEVGIKESADFQMTTQVLTRAIDEQSWHHLGG